MKAKDKLISKINENVFVYSFLNDKQYQIITKVVVGFIFNLIYAFYNGILGALTLSPLFIVSAIYYFLLSIMRLLMLLADRKVSYKRKQKNATIVGSMLLLLSVAYSAVIFFSIDHNTVAVYGEITMISIATYTFTKITVAIINAVRHSSEKSLVIMTINNIRYSEVAVSLLTMQQSMLVSFGNMDIRTATILNAFTGGVVCFFIVAMGINTIKNVKRRSNNGKIKTCKSK